MEVHEALTALAPICAGFPDPAWSRLLEAAYDQMGGFGFAIGNEARVVIRYGDVPEQSARTCRAINRARAAANGGALRARETAEAAHAAVTRLQEAVELTSTRLAEDAGGELHERYGSQISTLTDRVNLILSDEVSAVIGELATLSAASWEACSAVHP